MPSQWFRFAQLLQSFGFDVFILRIPGICNHFYRFDLFYSGQFERAVDPSPSNINEIVHGLCQVSSFLH